MRSQERSLAPNLGNPRMLWVGMEGEGFLNEMTSTVPPKLYYCCIIKRTMNWECLMPVAKITLSFYENGISFWYYEIMTLLSKGPLITREPPINPK